MKKLLVILLIIIVCLPTVAFSESLRMSPEQLKQQLSDNSLIILDARDPEAYQAGHIQGALSYPIALTYKNQKLNGKISSPGVTQKNFRLRGIDKKSQVVIYDNGDLVDAARLFWILEVYGLSKVKVLDHGYDHWISKDYPISLENHTAKPSQYIASLNHKRLASKFSTQLATRNKNQLIIDARNTSDYVGKTSSAKRFGHIPTAINLPASHNIAKTGGFSSLKSIDQLTKLYSDIPRNKKVVIYCAIGRVSSANYLALRELGYDVSNYDASWNEWGNDFKLPIEK
ncbi:sulfurtransferase [sulfur-oxidizing endosymbiont of Gigantopelta aegis]|uniref:sulfurtransferase n=1 Tax=sulfur-oxidizing endosymbiont of Gigantopelta aegis TaxID=2794934 RepID=UPI0018DD42BA|nr:sulfurtransferase [sulfur-oxidizing endosymbiont of Gigantopelta aegis]